MIVFRDDSREERSVRWQVRAALIFGALVAISVVAWFLCWLFWQGPGF